MIEQTAAFTTLAMIALITLIIGFKAIYLHEKSIEKQNNAYKAQLMKSAQSIQTKGDLFGND